MIRSRTLFDGSKGFVLFSEEHKKSNPFSYRKKVRILLLWCTISGRVKNSVQSACRPVRPPFCFAKPLVRLYAARGVHCSLLAFAHAQSWPLLTNPQPFLATSPRETNTSACAKCESVPKGMVQQKSRNIRCGFFAAPSGTLPRAKERRTVAFLTALRAAALFSSPNGAPDRAFLK